MFKCLPVHVGLKKTWLHHGILDQVAALDGQTGFKADRAQDSGRTRGCSMLRNRVDGKCSLNDQLSFNPDPFHLYLDAKSINEQHNCSLDVDLHCINMLNQQTFLKPALANFLSVLL